MIIVIEAVGERAREPTQSFESSERESHPLVCACVYMNSANPHVRARTHARETSTVAGGCLLNTRQEDSFLPLPISEGEF